MKILYLSCHSTLEYDETKLLTEMGHTVFSLAGSYMNPNSPVDTKRPGYPAEYQEHLVSVAQQCSKDNIHPELIDWADVIINMHIPEWLINNWDKIRHKRVIWRTIGQSTPAIESQLAMLRHGGMQIVRYSPHEKLTKHYIGEDAMIRFYKDENEFMGYNGNINRVITMSQSMKKRGAWCGYDTFIEATKGFDRLIYGPDNDGEANGGMLGYEELKQAYRDNRVYFYTGTYPASYTLNFIEAMMTGIPVVAVGPYLSDLHIFDMNYYEVPSIIRSGENGYISDNVGNIRTFIHELTTNHERARDIGQKGRQTAISLFGKEVIKKQWEAFL